MGYQKVTGWKGRPELRLLKGLSSPLKELFYQGKWGLEIFKDCVAVVGSRRLSEYGKRVIEKLIPELVFSGKTIVSGFMYGADQYAHQICLDSGGKTIAVLGWGINFPLSGDDVKLAKEIIVHGGLLLSEWETQKPTLWTFPMRNRIVAALSQEVFVVEAAAQSGSLITARLAKKLGRKVWAVPGQITSKTSVGTNNLITTGDAQMWLPNTTNNKQPTTNNDPILEILENEALTADELARKLRLPVGEIGAKLTMLVLAGQIIERSGKYFLSET